MANDSVIFQKRIRKVWFGGQWWFSVVDTVGVLTDSASPRKYWTAMKARIQTEGFVEVSTNCRQLKMRSPDGKFRSTDTTDTETLLRIVQSIPSPKAEPFKQWLARVGTERLQEEAQPSLAVERLVQRYRKQGYDDKWIKARIEKMLIRAGVTFEWVHRGAAENKQIALLTDTLSKGTFAITTGQHKEIKGLAPRQNLQDSMTGVELALKTLAEMAATEIHQARDSQGFIALQQDCAGAGDVAGAARRDIEARTGRPVVSSKNYKQLRQARQQHLQPSLFEAAALETLE